MSKKPRIVIIGAGMAGLTAANKLYTVASDLFELCVVEGGSRIGGRINTSEFSGERIEIGATWIHGIDGSQIYEIARETNALVSDQPWECMDSIADAEKKSFAEGGFQLKPSILEPISNLFDNLMSLSRGEISDTNSEIEIAGFHDFASRVSSSGGLSERSFGDFLKLGFDAYCKSVKDEETKEYGNWRRKSLENAIFAMYSNNQRTYTAADDLFSLDFAAESEYQMFPGEEITIPKGYMSVIDYLSSVLPPGLIQLNRKVTKIEWRDKTEDIDEETRGFENGYADSSPVKLHFLDGSVVYADHVIVTVSLGVLKAGIAEEGKMFCPPLPDFKIKAIRRLGYGVVNKLFVETTRKNFPFVQMAFHGEESEFKETRVPWWMRRTTSLAPIHSNSRVLLSWFAGKEALELESLADEEILTGISTTVDCLTRKEATNSFKGCVTDESADTDVTFTRVLKSKWGNDPLFLGSYSYVAVGSSVNDLDVIAEPLPKINKQENGKTRVYAPLQILFAGEATHRTHYSTTHGAYFSGLREAMRLLEYYQCVGC